MIQPDADHPLTGGCQCGAIRYALTGPPERVHLCHCRMCQKAVGGPFAASAPVRRSHFAWTRGTPASFASSSLAHRDFCGTCGTPLTWREAANPRFVDVSIATLDDPEPVEPLLHVWTESQIGWFEIDDHLARYPTNERPRPAL